MGEKKSNKMKAPLVDNNGCTTVDNSCFVENSVLSGSVSAGNPSTAVWPVIEEIESTQFYPILPSFDITLTIVFLPEQKQNLMRL